MANVDRTWTAYMDSLRVLWYRRVVNFDREQQRELVTGFRGVALDVRQWVEGSLRAAFDVLRAWFGGPWDLQHILALIRNVAIGVVLWVMFRVIVRWLFNNVRVLRGTARVRLKAGRLLHKLGAKGVVHNVAKGEGGAVGQALLHIRYGPAETWPPVEPVFRHGRRLARRGRRS